MLPALLKGVEDKAWRTKQGSIQVRRMQRCWSIGDALRYGFVGAPEHPASPAASLRLPSPQPHAQWPTAAPSSAPPAFPPAR